jgi:hypothetical protein
VGNYSQDTSTSIGGRQHEEAAMDYFSAFGLFRMDIFPGTDGTYG